MKIVRRPLLWSTISSAVWKNSPTKHAGEIKNKTPEQQRKFLPWATTKQTRITDEKHGGDIDLQLLSKFCEQALAKDLSYEGFISSHLQHGPLNDPSQALKMALAIKKMKQLVDTTAREMKRIEMQHIAHKRG